MIGIETLIGAVRQLPVRGKGRLFGRVAPRTGTRTVPVHGPYRMDLDLSDVVQRQMFMGCFGTPIATAVRRLLGPGDTFVDVGAHLGYFTLMAADRVGPGGRVFAVEPNPAAFARLSRHVEANRIATATVERVALSDAPGDLTLYLPPAAENRPHNVTAVPQHGWTPAVVPCARLADRLAAWDAGPVRLLKMDVEGAEPRVLAGAAGPLAAGRVSHVMTEVNGRRLTEAGSSPAGLIDQLMALGFLPAVPRGRRAVPVPVGRWDVRPDSEYDRLFVHRTAVA